MTMRRLLMPGLVWFVLSTLSVVVQAKASAAHAFLEVEVPNEPVVAAIDGGPHLVYEAHITNFGSMPVTLTRIDLLRYPGAVIHSYEGAELESSLGRVGVRSATPSPQDLQPGQRVILFVWIAIDNEPVVQIAHKISFRASDGSAGSVDVGTVTVRSEKPVALSPPLRGGPWAAVYNPDLSNGHRRVVFVLDGKARIPARFAIDWVKLGPDGRFTHDDPAVVSNSYSYGEDVLAVGDGMVAAVENRLPEPTPNISVDNEAGNYIAIDLGGSRFAFYEHLKPGSVRVKLHERVRAGQVLAALGASGSVFSGAHLHFHVAERNSPLAAEGLPFVLRRYQELGSFPSFEALGHPWTGPAGAPSVHSMSAPAPMTVLRFD